MQPRPISICVFCGSRTGARPEFVSVARQLGSLIGRRGHGLVYGGGTIGLMGVVAQAARQAGAEVTGIVPRVLVGREVGPPGAARPIGTLYTVESMGQRKNMMIQLSSAFAVIPGGLGTLDELFEVLALKQLGLHDKPVGILNTGGFYTGLLEFIQRAIEAGFVHEDVASRVVIRDEPEEFLDALEERIGVTA